MMSFYRLFIRDFSKRPDGIKRQPLYSPIGWGRCVFPVFATNDEEVEGCGTGFFIKGLDFGVTAEHLLDIERIVIPHGQDHGLELNLSGLPYGLTALLPSQAIMFGTRRIPPEYCQTAKRFIFDIVKKDDPLQFDRRHQRFSRRSDVLFLEFENQGIPPVEWRPRISARVPEVGDWVCAVGFPDIQMHQMAQEELGVFIREEGMAISYARVTQIELSGRTRYETSPIVFVDSDWPGGMSGGPVFNDAGRAVGVVSREMMGGGAETGRGSFTLLHPVLERAK